MPDPDAALPPFDIVPEPLRIAGLAVARGGVPVLAGLGAHLAPGDALILRGPNGSGKTTLLRTLAGLQPPAAGSVAPGPGAMAYASHADGIKATLSVAENLMFWARLYGHADIAAALCAFDLSPLAARPAASLSAGQKRRLGLARLVLTRRPVWLLDEPTVSLDREAVGRFAGVVTDHMARGGLAVIATHIDLGLPQARTLDVTPFRAGAVPSVAARAADAFAADAFGDDDGSAYL